MEEKIVAQKWRTTKIRAAILDILSSAEQPLSAKEIGQQLHGKKLKANKTTIYRDLDLFLREQLVTQVGFNDDQKRYELTSTGHHHHLICKQCERIEDIILSKELQSEEERIMKKTNFKITKHALEFYGFCGTCKIQK